MRSLGLAGGDPARGDRAVMVRHPTQFDPAARHATVATPTCCCCCCCLASIAGSSTMSGTIAHRHAIVNGIPGTRPTVLAALALPLSIVAFMVTVAVTGPFALALMLLVWVLLLRAAYQRAARYRNGPLITLTVFFTLILMGGELVGTIALLFSAGVRVAAFARLAPWIYLLVSIVVAPAAGYALGRRIAASPGREGAPGAFGYVAEGYPAPPGSGYPAPPGYPGYPAPGGYPGQPPYAPSAYPPGYPPYGYPPPPPGYAAPPPAGPADDSQTDDSDHSEG